MTHGDSVTRVSISGHPQNALFEKGQNALFQFYGPRATHRKCWIVMVLQRNRHEKLRNSL